MDPPGYFHVCRTFQYFLPWRQRRRRIRRDNTVILSALVLLTCINFSSAFSNKTHNFRHSGNNIDSLLNDLRQSKRSIDDPPRQPFEEGKCNPCTDDDIRREAIKMQILSKLGLTAKPRIKLPLPRDVILETLSRAGGNILSNNGEPQPVHRHEPEDFDAFEAEPDEFYARTSEIITFAEPGHFLNGQPLLEFSYSYESDSSLFSTQLRVKSALLWVRVALRRFTNPSSSSRNLTLWVFKVIQPVNTSFLSGKEFDQHTEMVASLSISLSHVGWHKLDITATVRDWYSWRVFPKEKLRLLVDCSGCKDEVQVLTFQGRMRHGRSVDAFSDSQRLPGSEALPDEVLDPNRPFLVVHTESVAMKGPRKRALNCVPGMRAGQCCKESFFVSFKELKWDDWIIAPKGYHANYCRGDCGGIHRTPDTFLNYHAHVIEQFRKMDRLTGIQACCAPVKFSSMSLIYFGPDNNIIKRDLPKMVVDQCGCP